MKIVLATSNKHKVQEINDIVNNSLPLLEERVGVRCQPSLNNYNIINWLKFRLFFVRIYSSKEGVI